MYTFHLSLVRLQFAANFLLTAGTDIPMFDQLRPAPREESGKTVFLPATFYPMWYEGARPSVFHLRVSEEDKAAAEAWRGVDLRARLCRQENSLMDHPMDLFLADKTGAGIVEFCERFSKILPGLRKVRAGMSLRELIKVRSGLAGLIVPTQLTGHDFFGGLRRVTELVDEGGRLVTKVEWTPFYKVDSFLDFEKAHRQALQLALRRKCPRETPAGVSAKQEKRAKEGLKPMAALQTEVAASGVWTFAPGDAMVQYVVP
jgi:hypothetical protein